MGLGGKQGEMNKSESESEANTRKDGLRYAYSLPLVLF